MRTTLLEMGLVLNTGGASRIAGRLSPLGMAGQENASKLIILAK